MTTFSSLKNQDYSPYALPTVSNVFFSEDFTKKAFIPFWSVGTLTALPSDTPWLATSLSESGREEENKSNYIRIVYEGVLFEKDAIERIDFYETKYGDPSEEFFQKWIAGELDYSEEFRDWANLYSILRK